jgi:PAS domain S-box-containing protein
MSSVLGPRDGAARGADPAGWTFYGGLLRHTYVRSTAALVVLTVLMVGGWRLLWPGQEASLASYLPLHNFLEICAIIACVLIFLAATPVRGGRRNRNMVILGAAFLGVAVLDFFHAQSYKGMPDLVTPAGPEKAIAFWLAGRFIAALALLSAAFLDWETTLPADRLGRWVAGVLLVVAGVTWVVLYRPGWLPRTFIEGQGLTAFKISCEYVLIALSLIAACGFFRLAARTSPSIAAGASFDPVALMCAAVVTAMAGQFFTLYSDVDGIFNVTGHVYKVIGAWLLYRGLVATNLFEIEARSGMALKVAQLGSCSWEIGRDFIDCDETAAAIWGIPAGRRMSMSELQELIHPDHREGCRKALSGALDPSGSRSHSVEYRVVRPGDGGTRYVLCHGRTEFREDRPTRVVAVLQDLTERRQGEGAVRSSEARLSGILSIAADAIITIDEQHRITLFNQGAESTFGYTAADALGQPLELLLPERLRALHGRHIEDFRKSGGAARRMGERREILGRRKDGSEFPAEASISQLTIDGATTFSVVLRDVTDRKRIETELERRVAERTAELSALVDALPDGVVLADLDRRLRTSNAAMTRLFGYTRQEIERLPAAVLYASETDRDAVAGAWRDWESGARTSPVVVECTRRDGTTFMATVLGTVVRDDQGRPRARVGIIRDITDDVKRERALSQAQRMEAFGQLTGGIAHDFNNLLTVISGNQELLEMRLHDPKALALLKRSQEAAHMGARLTARLLTFARRRQLEPVVLDLNEQITTLVELLQRAIGEHITLTTNLAPRLWKVRADPSEIENALLNLAINARDAMTSGGTLTIETAECVVREGEIGGEEKLPPGDYVLLSVSDSGIGMPPEVKVRAMEPFFTTKPPGKGTGLGLSTIYGFVRQSGGTVTIGSEVGRGTTIGIYLPRAEEAGRMLEPDQLRPLPVARPGEKVLVVEDDAAVRATAVTRMQQLGYAVLEADSGTAAIELLGRSPGDVSLVFSDVVMPGPISGFDLAKWVRTSLPHLPVLLTSGYHDRLAGVDPTIAEVRLLQKPYGRAELAQALRTALDGAAGDQALRTSEAST